MNQIKFPILSKEEVGKSLFLRLSRRYCNRISSLIRDLLLQYMKGAIALCARFVVTTCLWCLLKFETNERNRQDI